MNIDKSLFPELFEEKLLPWGPIRAVLELDVTPPDENGICVAYIRKGMEVIG